MSPIIDRRANDRHRSAINQQRFLRRYRAQVREAVARAITGRKVAEADRDASISIPAAISRARAAWGRRPAGGRSARQPRVRCRRRIIASARRLGAGRQRREPDGEGGDAFRFLSREVPRFLEDMALPDTMNMIDHYRAGKGSGAIAPGSPSSLAVVRTAQLAGTSACTAATERTRVREIDRNSKRSRPATRAPPNSGPSARS
jgi:uncharacterized sporulation protein YeaH/YhbH (DUF444 family)